MLLNDDELQTVLAVFTDCFTRFNYDELHAFIGSETIKRMQNLRGKLEYRGYCERHNIRYEDMTDEDFERAYFEENGI